MVHQRIQWMDQYEVQKPFVWNFQPYNEAGNWQWKPMRTSRPIKKGVVDSRVGGRGIDCGENHTCRPIGEYKGPHTDIKY